MRQDVADQHGDLRSDIASFRSDRHRMRKGLDGQAVASGPSIVDNRTPGIGYGIAIIDLELCVRSRVEQHLDLCAVDAH